MEERAGRRPARDFARECWHYFEGALREIFRAWCGRENAPCRLTGGCAYRDKKHSRGEKGVSALSRVAERVRMPFRRWNAREPEGSAGTASAIRCARFLRGSVGAISRAHRAGESNAGAASEMHRARFFARECWHYFEGALREIFRAWCGRENAPCRLTGGCAYRDKKHSRGERA